MRNTFSLLPMTQKYRHDKRARMSKSRGKSISRTFADADVPSCHHVKPQVIETLFSALQWDVSTSMQNHSWNIQSNASAGHVLETPVCTDTIQLLLPVTIKEDTLSVYFMEKVKKHTRAKFICVADIMKTIYDFYNKKPVIAEDLTYISLSEPQAATDIMQSYYDNPASIHYLRFLEFLYDHTRFAGLRHQNDNIYSVSFTS